MLNFFMRPINPVKSPPSPVPILLSIDVVGEFNPGVECAYNNIAKPAPVSISNFKFTIESDSICAWVFINGLL